MLEIWLSSCIPYNEHRGFSFVRVLYIFKNYFQCDIYTINITIYGLQGDCQGRLGCTKMKVCDMLKFQYFPVKLVIRNFKKHYINRGHNIQHCLSFCNPAFHYGARCSDPTEVHVRYVVEKEALAEVFLSVLLLSSPKHYSTNYPY
jgi:hypothetical protein